jgi:uncharacterized iron-regulated membrane protein
MREIKQSMGWLHSWSGLLCGWALFATFLTGSLTTFDNEISYWMQPEWLEVTSDRSDLDGTLLPVTALSMLTTECEACTPNEQNPILSVKLQDRRTFSGQAIDPSTGEMVSFRDTQGGDFFYHFHYGLLLGLAGSWIVGTAGIAMLIALWTGLAIHRVSLRDLIAFRARSLSQRAWLDTHNWTGLFLLPFHVIITVSGVMILWSMFMPPGLQFVSAGGLVLSILSDLHFVQFGGATMWWLYFVMGLGASAMIATGLVLWTSRRRKYHMGRSSASVFRLVESLDVATVAGLPLAIAAFFWANRLLPTALIDRSLWEVRCFFVVWCLCFAHSVLRRHSLSAWRDQLWGAATLLGLFPLLNGLTTNSHLFMTAPGGQWAMASVDLTALAVGALLGWIARRIGQEASETSTGVGSVRFPQISRDGS